MNELRKIIESFPETKDLKLKDNELITVYQYIKEKKNFDPNDETVKYEPVLMFNPLRVEYVFSSAYQKALDKVEKNKLIDTKYYGDYILEANIDSFETFNDERKLALEKSKIFIAGLKEKKYVKGLYIYGKNRSGKTYLLSAIANELSKEGINTVFAYVPDLIRALHGSISDNTVEEKVRELKSADLIVLDDIGGAIMSEWFRDQIFGPVIQHRLSMGLPVLFSSNLTLNNLSLHLTNENNRGDKFSAVRLFTRIKEMVEPVILSLEQYK